MTTCSFWTDFAGIKAKTVTEMIILTAIIMKVACQLPKSHIIPPKSCTDRKQREGESFSCIIYYLSTWLGHKRQR